jgi:hypothetical protein
MMKNMLYRPHLVVRKEERLRVGKEKWWIGDRMKAKIFGDVATYFLMTALPYGVSKPIDG